MTGLLDITRASDMRRRYYNPANGEITLGDHLMVRIAYCRVCDAQISAETAAANGGNCQAHAPIDTRWHASDDYRP